MTQRSLRSRLGNIKSEPHNVIQKVVTVPPRVPEEHSATVIFLHGSGGEAESFEGYANYLNAQPGLGHIKWLLPQANSRRITAAKATYPAWFDILQFRDLSEGPWDYEGISNSIAAIHELVQQEATGYSGSVEEEAGSSTTKTSKIDSSRIIISGLSQGGGTAIWAGLTCPSPLGGIACLSGRPLARDRFTEEISVHATSRPIFLAHGKADRVVPFELGESLYHWLKEEVGVPEAENKEGAIPVGVQFKEYGNLTHWIGDEEWDDFGNWLRAVLPEESPESVKPPESVV